MANFKNINHVAQSHEDTKCESCDKSFSTSSNLKRHIYLNHECVSCGKSFSQAGALKNHIYTVHEDHKDHKCESCGKSFTKAGDLKRHRHNSFRQQILQM